MMSEASLNETRSAPFDHDGTQEYYPSPTDRRLPPPPPPSTPISFDDECAEPPSTASDTYPESPVSFTSEARVVLLSHAKFAPSSSTRAEFRPKSVFYKTKPCKFYHSQGSCIKGDRCNFIHESGETNTTSKDVAGARDLEPGSGFPGNHITFSSYQKQHALPDKPVSSLKEQRRSNFYPVAWRVIGGGVMMGGHREICHDYIVGHCPEGEDCKFAHPDDDQTRNEPASPPWYAPIMGDQTGCASATVALPLLTIPPGMSWPQRSSRRRRSYRFMIAPPAAHMQSIYSAHKVVDGSTLLERACDHIQEDMEPEEDSSGPHIQANTPATSRTLVRPLSTPPAAVSRGAATIKLFQAEMP